jgi:hypothetical protein
LACTVPGVDRYGPGGLPLCHLWPRSVLETLRLPVGVCFPYPRRRCRPVAVRGSTVVQEAQSI